MRSILDEEKMSTTINKLNMYQKQEEINFNSCNQVFKNLSYSYQTDNTKLLEQKIFEITKKFSTISKLHDNNLLVLNKNLENYQSTKTKVESILNDINEEGK